MALLLLSAVDAICSNPRFALKSTSLPQIRGKRCLATWNYRRQASQTSWSSRSPEPRAFSKPHLTLDLPRRSARASSFCFRLGVGGPEYALAGSLFAID